LVLIGNYTFSESEIEVESGDTTILNDLRGPRPAREVFFDGDPLTGQSKHIVNAQVGIENTAQLQQLTLLFNYASKRVTSRGPASAGVRQADIFERPGLTMDLIARQGVRFAGKEIEFKFEARNLTNQDYEESQDVRGTRLFVNRYDLGRSFSLGASLKF
jgi:outer membrane receptor protein involved in Fe transport